MSKHAINEPQASIENQRGASRMHIRLQVPGSTDQDHIPITVHNMSATGILIETERLLSVGQGIAIELPEAESVSAVVVWRNAPYFGCRFDRPLSRVALSAAQLRNPIPATLDPVAEPEPPQVQESLGERLLRLRRSHGWSRTSLSARTGLSKPSIWAWESGRAAPRRDSLERLAEAFGISEAELRWGRIPTEGMMPSGRHDGPERAMEVDGRTSALNQVIESAKADIAASAGVDRKNVKIVIEY